MKQRLPNIGSKQYDDSSGYYTNEYIPSRGPAKNFIELNKARVAGGHVIDRRRVEHRVY